MAESGRVAPAGDSSPPPAAAGAWAPFGERVFAVLWLALLVAHMGTWIRDVGAGWLMTSLSPSATAVALVQVATTLPIFLLALPAGALADTIDRRRMLIAICATMSVLLALMAGVTAAGAMTTTGLLGSLLLAGVGSALTAPVLQSLTPVAVPRPLLRQAVALNSMGVNVSRAIGPALGGVLVLQAGVAWTFVVDALSWLVLLAALWWWRGASVPAATGRPEALGSAMSVGLRYVRHAPGLQRVLVRAAAFFLFASAYWALLPLVARRQLQGDAGDYGLLLASLGAGAVAGALALAPLRRRWSGEAVMRLGTAITVAALLLLAGTKSLLPTMATLGLAGAAWIAVLTMANVGAQTQLPNWVRGRGLAIYLSVFYGAMTAGSLLWGGLADAAGLPTTFLVAAGVGAVALALAWRLPLPATEPDMTPAGHWPEPILAEGLDADAMNRRGPVLVTVGYEIDPADTTAFIEALQALSAERLRDGAWRWSMTEDVAAPGHWLESFWLDDWSEHLRQHARVVQADRLLQQRVHALQRHGVPPQVRHWVARSAADSV